MADHTHANPLGVMLIAFLLWATFIGFILTHKWLPEDRKDCTTAAHHRGFQSGWLSGVGDCYVSPDNGRTWVMIRDWLQP